MDATRKGKGGGRALHVLEFVENTVLSTSWLKLKPLPPGLSVLKSLHALSQNLLLLSSGMGF